MVYVTTPEDNELLTDMSWRDRVKELLNNDKQYEEFGKGLADELEHFQKTNIPRCMKCGTDFVKDGAYGWKPACVCAPNLRLMIG